MVIITSQSGVVLGPLTTVWVPPATCTAILPLCATCDVGFQGQMCELRDDGLGYARDNTDCWPPVLSKVASPNPPFLGWGFYSPGLECPTGYTSACTAEYGHRPDWQNQFDLVPGETAIGCCPDGYQCTNYYGNTCIQVASTTTVAVETGACSGNDFTGIEVASFPDIITRTESLGGDSSNPPTAVQTVTELRTMTLLAPMFQINFQSTDLPDYTSTVSTTGTTSESTTTQSSATTATTAGASAGAENAGLSGGAEIGVIVGSIAGGLVLLALVAWGSFRWRQQRSAAAQPAAVAAVAASAWGQPPQAQYHQMYPQQQQSSEYYDYSGWGAAGPVELDRGQGTPAELDRGEGLPAELGRGQGTPAEMSTYTDDSRGHSPYKPPGSDGGYYQYR